MADLIRTGARNALTDVPGTLVGHAEVGGQATGTTAILFAQPAVAGVSVTGGAPGTRETDLLSPSATVQAVDAVILSGGSAFGLAAADGAMAWLAARGRGVEVAGARVPIVPAAILFDLHQGEKDWLGADAEPPYRDLGRRACVDAGFEVGEGRLGAGAGATTATGPGGVGTASLVLADGTTVAALAAVNAHGAARESATGPFWASPYEIGREFGGLGPPSPLAALAPPVKGSAAATRSATSRSGASGVGANTTIALVATDARLTKAQAHHLAVMAQDGLARAILPAHSPQDGDTVFAAATGARELTDHPNAFAALGHAAACCLARACARGVWVGSGRV